MYYFHNIGNRRSPNYHTIKQIRDCPGPISFDGVYENVYRYKKVLKGKDVILFVSGDLVGGDNSFDLPGNEGVVYPERFCTWKQLDRLFKMGCKIGWHGKTHRDLTKLSDYELGVEVKPPFPMEDFAYPYGRFNERVIEAVRKAGYKRAYTTSIGDNSRFQITRKII